MELKFDRRSLLKKGLFTLGGVALAPHLTMGAFGNAPQLIDGQGRFYYSPMLREHIIFPAEPAVIKAKLNANENPYGPPMAARKAVADSVYKGNRYAWKEMFDLVNKVAEKEGVTKDHIMMGPGSSDLLEKTAIVMFMNGGNVVSADPCYMSLIKVAEATGASWKAIPCKKDWSHDLNAMEAAVDENTKLVYVCNPNNPTGAVTSASELREFCKRVSKKVPVFVDEAYMELVEGGATESVVDLVADGYNVMVASTFSKIMGMAGLRIGYMAALPETLDKIQAITRGGMGISYTSVFAAMAAMDDTEFQDMTRKKNNAAKKYVCDELTSMGFEYIPSYTNFLIFPINWDGKEYLKKMSDKGVAVRSFDIMDKTWCRVSIGTMDEMKLFVSTLKGIS
ncbi:MAG: histidinol-phosphate transaminase [Spirosomataceae bacterium]